MNIQKVDALLKGCMNADAAITVPAFVPSEYGDFLRAHNGAEGMVSPEQYVILWRAEQLEELNADYSVSEFLPGVLLIGTDGGDTAYGIDDKGQYVSVPIVGMGASELRSLGSSLEEFLERIASSLSDTSGRTVL